MLKNHSDDGFLGPRILLMDDTVILATSRQRCLQKLQTLMDFCDRYGMQLNEKKTKLMVINGLKDNRRPLNLNQTTIQYICLLRRSLC
jgi:hypothetical protein